MRGPDSNFYFSGNKFPSSANTTVGFSSKK
jgi:hypothetical protein